MKKKLKLLQKIIAALLLILLWQAAAWIIAQKVLLPGPIEVASKLFSLFAEKGFFDVLKNSFGHICLGFLTGFAAGTLLAVLAGRSRLAEILLSPLMLTVKTVPVASFIILALIWFSSGALSSFISFLMVCPVVYNNILAGIKSTDPKMLQMADVFNFSFIKKLAYIWLPALKTHIKSACSTALGLCWKAGIAAELIGIPSFTIGERLYLSKLSLDTAELLAWTVLIVLMSALFEKFVILIIDSAYYSLEKS